MNLKLIVVAAAALVAGGATFAVSYDLAAAPSSSPATSRTSTVATRPVAAQTLHRAERTRWAACPRGTHLVRDRQHAHGTCVREVVHTVTLPAPAAPATSGTAPTDEPTAADHDEQSQEPSGTDDQEEYGAPDETTSDDDATDDHEDADEPDDTQHDSPGDGNDDEPGDD